MEAPARRVDVMDASAEHREWDRLLAAVRNGDVALVKSLLDEGTPVDPPPGQAGPLHHAASTGSVCIVQHLLSAGANPDARASGGTPLHCAVLSGSPECVCALIDAGADIDAVNADGMTPIMQAATAPHEDALLLLLDRGATLSLAFLPGTSMNLLHVCVDQELVRACTAVLEHPGGMHLARSTAMKPIHCALLNSIEHATGAGPCSALGRSHSTSAFCAPPALSLLDPSALSPPPADPAPASPALDMVHLLWPHSGLPPSATLESLYLEAQQLLQPAEIPLSPATSLATPTSSQLVRDAASPGQQLTLAEHAATPSTYSRSCSSDHTARRFCFTPTANLDCTPSDCSPLSRFVFARDDEQPGSPLPGLLYSPAASPRPAALHTCAAADSSRVLARNSTPGRPHSGASQPQSPAMRRNLRVRTHKRPSVSPGPQLSRLALDAPASLKLCSGCMEQDSGRASHAPLLDLMPAAVAAAVAGQLHTGPGLQGHALGANESGGGGGEAATAEEACLARFGSAF